MLVGTFYGREGADPKDSQVEAMTAAVIDVQHQRNDNRDRDCWFTVCSEGRDLDPHVQLFVRRALAVRRGIAKRPQLSRKW